MEKVVMLLSSLEEFSLEQGNHPSVTAVLGLYFVFLFFFFFFL
jgi:hypothetical protein